MARKPLPPILLVAANTMMAPLVISSGYRPAGSVTLLTSQTRPKPPASPQSAPMPNCSISSRAKDQLKLVWPLASISTRVMVRKIAIGSFDPDSISSVAPTRCFRFNPLPCSSENTAAASVEPTMAPSSRPCSQCSSSSQAVSAPVSAALISTPRLARDTAGHSPTRKFSTRVRMPPSSRMIANARLPIRKAVLASSN